MTQERMHTPLSTGDWVMAAVSFFLTPLAPLILGIYNLSKSQKSKAKLYFAVIGLQAAFVVLRVLMGV